MIFLKIFTFVPSFILFWVKSFSLIWWLSVQILLYMLVFQMWPSFERINHAQILIDLSLFKSFFFKLLRDFFVMDKFLPLKILHYKYLYFTFYIYLNTATHLFLFWGWVDFKSMLFLGSIWYKYFIHCCNALFSSHPISTVLVF